MYEQQQHQIKYVYSTIGGLRLISSHSDFGISEFLNEINNHQIWNSGFLCQFSQSIEIMDAIIENHNKTQFQMSFTKWFI